MCSTCRLFVLAATALLLCALAFGRAQASGGAYLDDIMITSNGSTVLFDDFNDGDWNGWTSARDVQVVLLDRKSRNSALYMNGLGTRPSATVTRKLDKNAKGLIELNTRVYVNPLEEQYNLRKGKACIVQITLDSGNTNGAIWAAVLVNPRSPACGVGVTTSQIGCLSLSKNPVLSSNRWAVVTLRIDPGSGIATAFLDGVETQKVNYDPSKYAYFRDVVIGCSFGDGAGSD